MMNGTKFAEVIYHLELIEQIENDEALANMVAYITSSVQAINCSHFMPADRNYILAKFMIHHYLDYNHFELCDLDELNPMPTDILFDTNCSRYVTKQLDYDIELWSEKYHDRYKFVFVNNKTNICSDSIFVYEDDVKSFVSNELDNMERRSEVVRKIAAEVQAFLRGKLSGRTWSESPDIAELDSIYEVNNFLY